jgi:hypothetical protein
MKKTVLAAILIMFLCSSAFALNLETLEESKPAPTPTESDCQDDPRLSDLNTLIAEAQKGPLVEKFKLTPERFFSLRPQILEAIGYGNIIICPDISIIAGIPSQLVPVDYVALLKQYEWAMRADDQKEIQRLRNTFKAAPMPAEAVASLGSYVRGDEAEVELWAKTLQIKPHQFGRKTKVLLYIDLFRAMGGRMEGDPSNVFVLVGSSSDRPEIVSILCDYGKRDETTEIMSSYGFKVYSDSTDVIKAATLAGVIK